MRSQTHAWWMSRRLASAVGATVALAIVLGSSSAPLTSPAAAAAAFSTTINATRFLVLGDADMIDVTKTPAGYVAVGFDRNTDDAVS